MIRNQLLKTADEGATAVEYAIMVALIAAVIIVAVVALGQNSSSKFQCISDAMPNPNTGACREAD